MRKSKHPSEREHELRRFRVTLEDMLTGEITIRTAILLETAIVLAKEAHTVVQAICEKNDLNRPLLNQK